MSVNSFVPWDVRVTMDLFLGGIGVGAFLVAVLAAAKGEAYRSLKQTGAVIAPLAVALGLLFLLLELGRPERFITTLFQNNSTSVMSWGVYLQAIFLLLAVIYAVLVLKQSDNKGIASGIKWLGTIFGLFVGSYHGLLLSSNVSRFLWNNGIIPLIFLLSAVLTGFAMVLLINSLVAAAAIRSIGAREVAASREGTSINISSLLFKLILLQGLTIFFWIFTLARGNKNMVASLEVLLTNYGVQWWLGVVLIGIILPLLFCLYSWQSTNRGQFRPLVLSLTSILLLIGGFVMKNVLLAAGQITYPLF